MSNGRYKIELHIGNFAYQNSGLVSQAAQLKFASNKVTNANTVPVEADLTVYSGFRTATVTQFENNLLDNNFQMISSLKLSISKKVVDSDNGSNTIVTREYNFDKVDSMTDLASFIDWKTYQDKNLIKTSIDPTQCATAVHTVSVAGYNQLSFTALGKVSIYDEYNNNQLSGTELLNKVSNYVPYAATLDQSNAKTVNLALDGILYVPANVNFDIQILRNCNIANGLDSNYNYNLAPILGDFDYLQTIADNNNF